MKNILGLDIGTNSIGWALIQRAENENEKDEIIGIGSRIIPLGDDKGNFESGKKLTRAADRRITRQSRRGNHRYKLRRNKLIYVLYELDMLPDFFKIGYEKKNENGYKEKILNFLPAPEKLQSLFIRNLEGRKDEEKYKNENGKLKYKKDEAEYLLELRTRALEQPVTLKELGRILYLFNQRRGYNGGGDEEKQNVKVKGEDTFVKKYETVIIEKELEPIQETDKKNKIWSVELVNTETGEQLKGKCYAELKTDDEIEVEMIKKSQEDTFGFFELVGFSKKYDKAKSTLVSEKFKAKIIRCKISQETSHKKYAYDIALKDDERKGKFYLKDIKKIKDIKIGEEIELEITTYYNEDESIKKIDFALPYKTNWKKNLEAIEKLISERKKIKEDAAELDSTGKGNYHVCHYFLDKIKEEKNTYYRLKDNVILRKRYQQEFEAIWKKQSECNEQFKQLLSNQELLKRLVWYIFPGTGKNKLNFISEQEKYRIATLTHEEGLHNLIAKQIIYYQRQLKPQPDLIGKCQYEKSKPVIPKSHPLYQEFRLWKQINQIFLEEKQPEGITPKYKKVLLTQEQKLKLYNTLFEQKQIIFDGIIKATGLKQQGKNEEKKYFVKGYNKKYVIGNETYYTIQSIFKKEIGKEKGMEVFKQIFSEDFYNIYQNTDFIFLHDKMFERIGNEMDEDDDRVKSIREFLERKISDNLINIKSLSLKLAQHKFSRQYGSLSKEAINNLLPLMKPVEDKMLLSETYKNEITKLENYYQQFKDDKEFKAVEIKNTNGENIKEWEKGLVIKFLKEYYELDESLYKGGWQEYAAAQLIYGRHTAKEPDKLIEKYHDVKPIGKEETLRNPVVEQIVNETLQLVKSVWKQYFGNNKTPFNEIRVELARELKNNAEEREKIFKAAKEGEKMNKEAAYEIMLLEYEKGGKKVKPKNDCVSDGCNSSCREFTQIPTAGQILKYKLWKEQGMVSPYTGQPIPLCKLFDGSQYNKEHIIPKQRFFDNSNTNLVIAEKWVNDKKDNLTALEFIEQCKGLNGILPLVNYERFIRKQFSGRKKNNLLLKEIPEDFVERQKKDTQYITIKVREKLAEIVGLQRVTTTTGSITDYLREHWHLNDAFKKISRERFELMGELTTEGKENWAYCKEVENKNGGYRKVFIIKEWSKRLDHRHHAIDALVIACTSQGQITQLNNLNQLLQKTVEEKKDSLKIDEGETPMQAFLKLTKEEKEKILGEMESNRVFDLPWPGFVKEAKENIETIIVSHKPKQRILIQNKDDKKTKSKLDELILKIRSKLHQETLYGLKEDKNAAIKTINIKSAFDFADFIIDAEIKKQVQQRINDSGENNEDAKETLSDEPIIDIKGKKISKTDIQVTEKNIYRFPLEKLGQKKSIKSFIEDNIIGEDSRAFLFDHLHRYCFLEIIEDKESNLFNNKEEKKMLAETFLSDKTLITAERVKQFYEELNDNGIEKKLNESLNGKTAFSDEGIDALTTFRKEFPTKKGKGLPKINAVKVLYATGNSAGGLQPIERINGQIDYVKTGDNYCFAILQKGNERIYKCITFFDAVKWVTNKFGMNKQTAFNFPKNYFDRLKYVEDIIRNKLKSEDTELLYLLQQDELVYLPVDENDAHEFHSVPSDSGKEEYKKYWFDKERKRTKRIYRVVKFTGDYCFFTPHNFSTPIWYRPIDLEEKDGIKIHREREIPKKGLKEYDTKDNCSQFVFNKAYIDFLLIDKKAKEMNKEAKKLTGSQAKEKKEEAKKLFDSNRNFEPILIQATCIKIEIDRLGNISFPSTKINEYDTEPEKNK